MRRTAENQAAAHRVWAHFDFDKPGFLSQLIQSVGLSEKSTVRSRASHFRLLLAPARYCFEFSQWLTFARSVADPMHLRGGAAHRARPDRTTQ
jgi:hypothetical protein